MIIVQLKGGLGNQLFQYAAGLALAAHRGTVVKADISQVNNRDKVIGTYRSFDLQALVADPAIATEAEIMQLTKQSFFERYIDKLRPPHKRKIYKEAHYTFDPHFFDAGDNIYLKGYRQSEKYFGPARDMVARTFCFKEEVVQHVSRKAGDLRNTESVAIHIRRGDYMNAAVADYHGFPGAEYYQQAIDLMETRVPGCRFFIFSDDPAWVSENLKFNYEAETVSGNITHTHFEDFHLISQCRHQVIANSTFSWWAAWLNPHPGKMVIAPQKWFNNAPHDTRDLIPESWMKI